MNIQNIEDKKGRQIEICPQYLVITPYDHKTWNQLRKELIQINQNYSTDRFMQFLEGKLRAKGYSNIRLVKRVKTDYFWNGVTQFMLATMVESSHLLSCSVPILVREQDSIIKLTKLQIFLILCHMFMGTFPDQLYSTDLSFGRLMAVMDDEDEITCKVPIQLRLNKLKSIVRYFCLFYKRSRQHSAMLDEIISFQRYNLNQKDIKIPDDSIRLCKVEESVGQFYANDNQINSISINNIKNIFNPIPGIGVFDGQMDVEEQIFFSHPQMFILHALMHEKLQKFQSLVIHGAEKYSALDAVRDHDQFNFTKKYKDNSHFNKIHNSKITTFIFINRSRKNKNVKQDIFSNIFQIYSGIKACEYLHHRTQKLISGYFGSIKNKRNEIDWDLKFLVDWMAATIANWESLTYYVEGQTQSTNLEILVKELQYHTVQDILNIIDEYFEFKQKHRAKLSLIDFCKDFAL